jgi:hypothetical protein
MWSSSVCCIFSLSLIISISHVDVGDLPNHVKYCVSVLSLLWAMIMNTTVPHGEKSPTNWYQSLWFISSVWFLLKNESCQNGVLNIPLWRAGRDEHTAENDTKFWRGALPHAPTRADEKATYEHRHAQAPHASSSPGWADTTRIPVDPTHVADPDKDDVSMT